MQTDPTEPAGPTLWLTCAYTPSARCLHRGLYTKEAIKQGDAILEIPSSVILNCGSSRGSFLVGHAHTPCALLLHRQRHMQSARSKAARLHVLRDLCAPQTPSITVLSEKFSTHTRFKTYVSTRST